MYRSILAAAALLAAAAPAHADPITIAAQAAATEVLCDWPDFSASEQALRRVVAEGIPEDIAIEIIADLAWLIVDAVPIDEVNDFCGASAAIRLAPEVELAAR